MEPFFINTTVYSKKELNRFLQFHSKKYARKYIFFTIVFILYMLMLIIISFINAKWNIALAVIFIFSVAYIYFIHIKPDKKQINNKKQLEQSFTFSFYDNQVISIGNVQKSKFRYIKFYRIFETKTNFYLYINKEYSLILNKEGFEKGNIYEFRNFIRKKCWLRYRKIA